MKKSNKVLPKKGRGRPATGRDPVTAIRLPGKLIKAIEDWAAEQGDEPNRSEAIRRLVGIALKSESRLAHGIVELGPKAKSK